MGARGHRVFGVWVCVSAICTSTLFQNCGPSFQHIDFEQKQSVLKNESVFGGKGYYIYLKSRRLRAVEEGGNYAGLNGGEGSIPTRGPNGEVVIPVEAPTSTELGYGNIPTSSNGVSPVEMQGGVMVGPNWYVPPPPRPASVPAQSSGGNNNMNMLFGVLGAVFGVIGAFSSPSPTTSSSSYSGYDPGPAPTTFTPTGAGSDACRTPDPDLAETLACSPLLIAFSGLKSGRKTLELTHPFLDGRFFDIAGTRSWPLPHTKKRISWLNDASNMFIVLPDPSGQVHGIDQMFGDSTLGPDGKYAKNGYHALAKWDGMNLDGQTRKLRADGFITNEDPIFSRLQLWSDRNLDAVADARELIPLTELNIEVIDLHYDASYIEMDKYGNFTTFKSVAKDASGTLHVLFDIWFNVHEQ